MTRTFLERGGKYDIIFERYSQDSMDSGDAVLWKPLVKL